MLLPLQGTRVVEKVHEHLSCQGLEGNGRSAYGVNAYVTLHAGGEFQTCVCSQRFSGCVVLSGDRQAWRKDPSIQRALVEETDMTGQWKFSTHAGWRQNDETITQP